MVSNSGGVTNLSESFEVLTLNVMQFFFGFTKVKNITIPATDFVDNLRFLRAIEATSVRKERLIAVSVMRVLAFTVLRLSFTLFACISRGHLFSRGFLSRLARKTKKKRGYS